MERGWEWGSSRSVLKAAEGDDASYVPAQNSVHYRSKVSGCTRDLDVSKNVITGTKKTQNARLRTCGSLNEATLVFVRFWAPATIVSPRSFSGEEPNRSSLAGRSVAVRSFAGVVALCGGGVVPLCRGPASDVRGWRLSSCLSARGIRTQSYLDRAARSQENCTLELGAFIIVAWIISRAIFPSFS